MRKILLKTESILLILVIGVTLMACRNPSPSSVSTQNSSRSNVLEADALGENANVDDNAGEADNDWENDGNQISNNTEDIYTEESIAGNKQAQDLPTEEESCKTTDKSDDISLIMVGDILLHTPVENSAKQENGEYDYSAIFANMKETIESADLALVNQEVIIGGEELGISGYPAFNAPYAMGDDLVLAGFDVICHATNHALDKGKKGLLNCIKFWNVNYPDIAVLGIHESEEDASDLYIYEQDGLKIAILNYTYGTNGIPLPQDMPYAVDLLDEQKIIEDIARAEKEADFTIVCPHWGTEYLLSTDSSQKKWTKIFLENGVDLVIGTHPHVIEPIEWVRDEETGNEMLVYYSLGNFVNWTSGTGEGVANRMVGGMAEVTIGINDTTQKACVQDFGITGLVCHVAEGVNQVTVYPIDKYTDELAQNNAIISQDATFSLQYCLDLCARVWGEFYSE